MTFYRKISHHFSQLSKFSDVLFKFKHSISLHEHLASCMNINPLHLHKIPSSDVSVNRVASGFLAKTSHLEMYRYSKDHLPADISTPSSSLVQIRLLLEENEELKNLFIRFRPDKIRVGRLLEALDFISNYVAYYHIKSEPIKKNCTMMTVCVDHLKFFMNLRADRNITINAYPTWSGNSTVEIRTDLFQKQDNGDMAMASSALFLMVARDFNDYNKPYVVPELIIDKEEDKQRAALRYELGKLNQLNRKALCQASLFKTPPSQEETFEMHEIFQSVQEKLIKKSPFISMKDTRKTKSHLMYNQDKNINGKIFGGYLMRESIEFAWLVAYLYANGDHPEFEDIDDFHFISSIDVGSIVDFEAQVTFAEGSFIHVQVIATKYPRVVKEGEKERQKCTELHITFKCFGKMVRQVVPTNYEDAMTFLEAKRRVLKQTDLHSV